MSNNITIIEQQASRFLSLEVKDQESLLEASTYLISAKKELKTLKADMDTLIDPIKESIDLIKEKYDPRLKALKSVIDSLTLKTSMYQTVITNSQLEAKQKITDKVESGYIKPETAISKLEALPTVEKNVTTDAGGMSFIATPCFEVEDLLKLPIDYHLPNEVEIRKAMKAGTHLAGVRYWTEQRPRNSR